jgi:DNA-binding CsgD family transcriptional regulator
VGEKRMLDNLFLKLIDGDPSIFKPNSESETFASICKRLGVDHIAYLGLNLPKRNHGNYFVHNTYAKNWAAHYETQKYVSIDPIVRLGLNSIMPLDWSDLGRLGKEQRSFFGEAKEYCVGERGLTFPLRGLHNETAIISISTNMSEKDWRDFKREKMKEMRIFGDLIHQNIVNQVVEGTKTQDLLSDRERECLRWYAEGKTFQDIGDLIGISPRTVRFFLEGARHKLNCLNSTHTVVTALSRGMI